MNETLDAILDAMARPDTARLLGRCLAEHDAHAGEEYWLGFTWADVRGRAAHLNELIIDGVLEESYRSNSCTNYRLMDPEAVRAALADPVADRHLTPEPYTAVPADLFAVIEGHEALKNLLRLAVASPRPVHVLIEGPAATAKSMFLSELARLQPSRYLLGGTTSRAGLTEYLLAERPRFLIVDEIDKMGRYDVAALLSVMESGIVSRLVRRDDQMRRVHVWVFAGANRIAHMRPELLSRFWHARLAPYSEEEFRRVVVSVLMKREGVDAEMAHYIANQVATRSHDPRDAVRVARLSTAKADIDLLVAQLVQR